ncbi:phage tail tape measure protein [Celeribacter neptunius]|uniref:Phage tail tape measure protein, lambda family n=1 Tax=Celeribacter neptunius TaxID=588602 RepID=A0A1I3LH07_9RHOB|nr:phage tail tape measure protein [Celeribacter neptunius]SFI84044.1 phage tail tape measure protein, lambda family [Celeribacter neptunius]
MTNELPGLIVPIEGRIDRLEKALAKANRAQQRFARDAESRSKRTAGKMNKAFGGVKFSGAGVAAGVTLIAGAAATAIAQTRVLAREVATVGNEARRAGVSAEDFQIWAHVAEQNRIPVDSLIDGLKELNLRADEFVMTGKGSGADAFQRLGYTAEELARKLKDPSALMSEILERLEQMDKAAQIRIADELFGGTGGERFVELLGQGARKIEETKREAVNLGLVMSDDLIAKADILDRQFTTVANTVGTTLKSAIISAAYSLSEFIDGFRAFEAQRTATLESRQAEIMAEKAGLYATDQEQSGWSDRKRSRSGTPSEILQERIAELDAEENKIIGILSQRNTPAWSPSGDAWTPPETPVGGTSGTGPGAGGGAGSQGGYEGAVAALERQRLAYVAEAQAAQQAATQAQGYGDAVEYARVRAQLLAAAQAEGRAITPELSAEIDRLAKAYVTAGMNAEQAAKKLEQVEGAGQRGAEALSGMFMSVFSGAKSAEQAVLDLLAQLAQAAMNKLLMQLFSGAFGGVSSAVGGLLPFASGGYTGDGGTFEPKGVVHGGEFVMSKRATERLGVANLDALHRSALRGYASGGFVGAAKASSLSQPTMSAAPSITIAPNISVNASGGSPEKNRDLAAKIASETERSMKALVQSEITKMMRPGGVLRRSAA